LEKLKNYLEKNDFIVAKKAEKGLVKYSLKQKKLTIFAKGKFCEVFRV